MFERLSTRAARLAEDVKDKTIADIAARPVPAGVSATATPDGVTLSGKRLRRRFLNDPALRNFAR
jgi:hypothetical protein